MNTSAIDILFRRLIILAVVVFAVYLIHSLSSVIIPFITAFILAYFFNPLVQKLERFIPRWLSIIAVYLSITFIIVIALSLLIPALWEQLQQLWIQLQNANDFMPMIIDWYNDEVRATVKKYISVSLPLMESSNSHNTVLEYLKNHYNISDAQGIFTGVFSSGMTIINNATLVVLIPVFMFYFLLNWNERLQILQNAIPKSYKKTVITLVTDCDKALMAFVQGQLLVMFLLGTIYAVQLQFIGLELGLIIGMIAGLASFVPYLGFAVGFTMAIGAGLFQFGLHWLNLGLITGAFIVGQVTEAYVLQPFLLGDKIGLSPLWVMFSVLAGASLLGFVGMLIALPVAAILNVLFQYSFNCYLHSDFYKGRRQLRLFD